MVIRLSSVTSNGDRVDHTGAATEGKEETLVRITWRDIIQYSDWTTADKVECPVMESVGWLVSQDEDTVKIATTLDRHDSLGEHEGAMTYYGILAFPSGCVLSCVPLHTSID